MSNYGSAEKVGMYSSGSKLPRFLLKKVVDENVIKRAGEAGYKSDDSIAKIKTIGNGSGGARVYACYVDGWRCALKEINAANATVAVEEMKREIETLSQLPKALRCSYLAKFLGAQMNDDQLRLFMPLYDGDLQRLLVRLRGEERCLSESTIARYISQMLVALKRLHAECIAHCDLRPHSVLCSRMRPRVAEEYKFTVFPEPRVCALFGASGVEDRQSEFGVLPPCLVVSGFAKARKFDLGGAEGNKSPRSPRQPLQRSSEDAEMTHAKAEDLRQCATLMDAMMELGGEAVDYSQLEPIRDLLAGQEERAAGVLDEALLALKIILCPIPTLEELLVAGTEASLEFLHFAAGEFASENILFYLRVEEFKLVEDREARFKMFADIYTNFIQLGSKYEIELTPEERDSFEPYARESGLDSSYSEMKLAAVLGDPSLGFSGKAVEALRDSASSMASSVSNSVHNSTDALPVKMRMSMDAFDWDQDQPAADRSDSTDEEEDEEEEEEEQPIGETLDVPADVFNVAQEAVYRNLEVGSYARYREELEEQRNPNRPDERQRSSLPGKEDLESLISAITSFGKSVKDAAAEKMPERYRRSNSLGSTVKRETTMIFTRNKGGNAGLNTLADSCSTDADAGDAAEFRPAADVGAELRALLQEMYASHLHDQGNTVDYHGLASCPQWPLYLQKVEELQRVDLDQLGWKEALAFWLNVYNCLVIHGNIEFGAPKNAMQRNRFHTSVFYQIGGHNWTPNDIVHGVLRANRTPSYARKPVFDDLDPRRAWSLPVLDPRVHFCMCGGAKSCPPIRVFDEATIEEALDDAVVQFFAAGGIVSKGSGHFQLSAILKFFAKDFGETDAEVLEWVSKFTSDEIRSEIAAALFTVSTGLSVGGRTTAPANASIKLKISYMKYDWTQNQEPLSDQEENIKRSPSVMKISLGGSGSYSSPRITKRKLKAGADASPRSPRTPSYDRDFGASEAAIPMLAPKAKSSPPLDLSKFVGADPPSVPEALDSDAALLLRFAGGYSVDARDTLACWLAIRDFHARRETASLRALFTEYMMPGGGRRALEALSEGTSQRTRELYNDYGDNFDLLIDAAYVELEALLQQVTEELVSALEQGMYPELLAQAQESSPTKSKLVY